MEKLVISEQEIVNALCVYISRKKQTEPEEVEVELMHDDTTGFTGEAFVNNLKIELETLNIIEAVRLWLDEFLHKDPFLGIELKLDDEQGIIALVGWRESSVVTSLKESYHDVTEGTRQIVTTGETFEEIRSAVTAMSSKIHDVADNLHSIQTNNEEMGQAIQNIASVSEESAAGVEQISASTQQTSSSMEEVAASSDDLAKLAEELNQLVNEFKL